MGFITVTDFKNAVTGAQTSGLGAPALQQYIDDASAAIEEFCDRSFVAATGIVEELYSDQGWSVRIGPSGFVSLVPKQTFPITTVTSITFSAIGRSLTTSPYTPTTTTISSTDIKLIKDRHARGAYIRVLADFSRYRHAPLLFTVTYSGGFATYPDILKRATILWTTGLLKRRGDQTMVATESGLVAYDSASVAAEIRSAMGLVQDLKRVI